MKKGWQTKKLREVCELVNGRAYSKSELLAAGKYRVLRVGNFFTNDHWYYSDMELEEKKYCDTGDLLYAWSASFGPRMWTGGKVIYHYHIWKVVHDSTQIDQKFLFYFFQWDTEKIKEDQGTGTTMMHVSMGSMNERDIDLPPLAEQQRIVGLLDEAFEGLATAKANAEKNLQNARALFESHLQSVFAQRGPGWVEKRLGEALVKTETTDPTRSPQTEFDYIDVSSVSKETLAIQETQRLQGKDAPSRARKLVRTNDVIFATIRPTLRRIAIVPDELDSQVCSTGYFVLRAKPDMDHRLVFYFLQTETFMTAMETLQKGASYPAVTDGDVRLQTIPIPPLNEQKTIAAKLESLRKETQRLTRLYEQKHVALEALKKSLLHQAFTGEL